LHEIKKNETTAQQVHRPGRWPAFAQMLHAMTSDKLRSHQHCSNPTATNAVCGNIHISSILLHHSSRQLQEFH
jgi:hypothetical protein